MYNVDRPCHMSRPCMSHVHACQCPCMSHAHHVISKTWLPWGVPRVKPLLLCHAPILLPQFVQQVLPPAQGGAQETEGLPRACGRLQDGIGVLCMGRVSLSAGLCWLLSRACLLECLDDLLHVGELAWVRLEGELYLHTTQL